MLFRIFAYGAALFTCLGPCDFVAGGISGKRFLMDKILRGLQEAAPVICKWDISQYINHRIRPSCLLGYMQDLFIHLQQWIGGPIAGWYKHIKY